MARNHRLAQFRTMPRHLLAQAISAHEVHPETSGSRTNFDEKLRDDLLEFTFPRAVAFADLLQEIGRMEDTALLNDDQKDLLCAGMQNVGVISRIIKRTRDKAIAIEEPGTVPTGLAGTQIRKLIAFSSHPAYKYYDNSKWDAGHEKRVEDSLAINNLREIHAMLGALARQCGVELPSNHEGRLR